MVKTIYSCEKCGRTYDTFDEAKYCEERKDRSKDYPAGLMFGCHLKGVGMDQYVHITWAVDYVNTCKWNPHFITINTSACKDEHPTSVDVEQRVYDCSWAEIPKYTHASVMDPGHPTFKRMVEFLQAKNIVPTVWDGNKPISLEEHAKIWAKSDKSQVDMTSTEKNQTYMPIMTFDVTKEHLQTVLEAHDLTHIFKAYWNYWHPDWKDAPRERCKELNELTRQILLHEQKDRKVAVLSLIEDILIKEGRIKGSKKFNV